MQDYKTMISMCAEQEEKFQFEHFSREDALKIGLKLHENAKEQPVAVEITVNGLVVFRYFAEGAKPDSERNRYDPCTTERRRRPRRPPKRAGREKGGAGSLPRERD